jgi:hypothetical protein
MLVKNTLAYNMPILDKHKSLLPNESSEVYVIDKHTSLFHGNIRLLQKGVIVKVH